VAVMRLIESMTELGSRRENLVAKIFGGADQLTIGKIGEKNVTTAEGILQRESVQVVARSTGGVLGRKIVFYTDSNVVMLKYLTANQPTHESN
jgi:chemotaxis protein CheD